MYDSHIILSIGTGQATAFDTAKQGNRRTTWIPADADADRSSKITNALDARRLDRENASALDVLITMLPNSDIVEAVLLGSHGDGQTNGWVAALPKSAVVIDMSSSEPARSRALATTLESKNSNTSTPQFPAA